MDVTSRQYVKHVLHSEFYFRTVPNIITVILIGLKMSVFEILIMNSREPFLYV